MTTVMIVLLLVECLFLQQELTSNIKRVEINFYVDCQPPGTPKCMNRGNQNIGTLDKVKQSNQIIFISLNRLRLQFKYLYLDNKMQCA